MKKKIILIISLIIVGLIGLFIIINNNIIHKELTIDEVLETESYSYLSNNVKSYIKEYYEETGEILKTEKNATENSTYLNPSFIEYLDSENKDEYFVIPSLTTYNPVLGSSSEEFPSKFDLRDANGKNYVTPNKNQGNEGLCWAYSTASLLETHDLISKNKSYDDNALLFSEKQMDYALSRDGLIGGNNIITSTHNLSDGGALTDVEKLLIEKLGGVSDSFDIVNQSSIVNMKKIHPSIVFNRNNVIYEPSDTLYLNNINDDLSKTELNESMKSALKKAIYNYGGLIISTQANDSTTFKNMSNTDDYLMVNDKSLVSVTPNHALHMIGWDDDYEYSFCYNSTYKIVYRSYTYQDGEYICPNAEKKTGKGAWILKNSWGSQYSYIYLTYDSFIGDALAITNYSTDNWDNSYKYSGIKFENENIDNEKVTKIKIKKSGEFTLYYSKNGDSSNYQEIGKYSFDDYGYHTIDLSDKNIIVNSNSRFRINSSEYQVYLLVFTENSDDSINMSTNNYTYSIDNEFPSNDENLSITIKTNIKGIIDGETLTYKIKNSNNEYLDVNAYEVNYNNSYCNMVTPTITLKSNYAKKGNYVLETIYNGNTSTSDVLLEIDYISINGSGTNSDPWQIENTSQFNMIRNAPYDNYILMNDLDFEYDTQNSDGRYYNSGNGWKVIDYFYGNLNGNNKTIKNLKTSTGLFGLFKNSDAGLYVCKQNECGIHNLNIDNLNSNVEKADVNFGNSIGGIIHRIDISNTYNSNFSNLSISNSNISVQSGYYVGGIVGFINEDDYHSDFTNTVLKIDNWYNNMTISYDSTKNNYSDSSSIGGLIGQLKTTTGMNNAYFSLNNVKADINIDMSKAKGEFTLSDIIASAYVKEIDIKLNNIIGILSNSTNSEVQINKNAFINGLYCNKCKISINGSRSTLEYNQNNNINITNSESNLNRYQIAKSNYNDIIYYEDNYYVYNEYNKNLRKVAFSDKFDVYGDKIPTLKTHSETYPSYYKEIRISALETKSITDLISNNSGSSNLNVYKSYNCELDICNNVTDETIINYNNNQFTGLKSGSTTLILSDPQIGYLDTVTIYVMDNDDYILTFNNNYDNSYNNKRIIKKNTTYGTLPVINRDNYTFVGWFTEENGGTEIKSDTIFNGSSDITLYAHWQKNAFTVTFDSNGGTNVESQIVNYGDKASIPGVPVKEGYTFKKWLLEGNEYDFDSLVTEDITLFAQWEINKYTINFDSNGGTNVESQIVNYNDKASIPGVPVKEGYTFKKWLLEGNEYDFDSLVTEDITLFAQWEINKYTINFDSNGGTNVESQIVNYGEKVSIPSNPSKDDYSFVEWQLNNQTYDFNTIVTGNITLVAKWTQEKYTVTFDSNGGSSIESQIVNYGEKVSIPSDPVNLGYSFVEWQLNNQTYDFNTKVTSNITLKAVWTVATFTVTFNSNGGSSVDSQTVKYGFGVSEPNPPTKDGYTFEGWFKDTELTTIFSFQTGITSDTTLYAKWKEIKVVKDLVVPVIKVTKITNNNHKITWELQNLNETYYIYRSVDNKKWTYMANTISDNYTDTGTYGVKYYYKIYAKNNLQKTSYSNVVSIKVKPNKVNLKIKSASTNNIKLSWDKVKVTGYTVERSTDNKKWSTIKTITKNSTLEFNNTSLKANKKYYYRVRAYKTVSGKKIYGGYSDIVDAKTAPNKTSIKVTTRNTTSLNVKVGSSKGATRYLVYRSDSKEGTYTKVGEVESGTYKDKGLKTGKTYYYKVKACNTKYCSGYSKVVSKKVIPSSPVINLNSPKTKVIEITISEISDVDGYEVYRSTSKKGKYNKVGTKTNDEELIVTNSTKKGTTYYYKAKSYKVVGSKKVYSDYGNITSRKSK